MSDLVTPAYPRWKHHRSGASRLVYSPAEEPQGPDWADAPFRIEPKPPETVDSLKARVKQLEAELARRTEEISRLKAVIEEAQTAPDENSKPETAREENVRAEETAPEENVSAAPETAEEPGEKSPANDEADPQPRRGRGRPRKSR